MDTIDKTNPHTVTSPEDLSRIYAKPLPAVATKATDHITEVGRAFIAASPFLVLATSDGDSIDCSPKGDAPGFVQLLDDRTLLIPDRPGNNRIDGMQNLLDNPKVGIIFMVPGSNETFRVNGSATISTDPELLARFEVRGKPPRVVMVITVDEAFNHCPKAFVRAKLWDATARPTGAPSHGDFAAARDGKDADYAKDYNEKYTERLKTELY
jgi:PPOX class probable FMN-dependent enzyme